MTNAPHFFCNSVFEEDSLVTLDPETTKHIWQVLRMEPGEKVMLVNGRGASASGRIRFAERHKCNIVIGKISLHKRKGKQLHLGICLTRNNSRNEWLLEKATELGVSSIIPIAAERSERVHIRTDRWQKILQSAILQSQQYYLPELAETIPLQKLITTREDIPQKLIAHCLEDKNKRSLAEMLKPAAETMLLIGPEGDFSANEVNLCLEGGYKPVSLGSQRLRTETAAITAAAYFNVMYNE